MRVAFCHNCGRIIDSEFSFCPWCGIPAYEPLSIERLVSKVFIELEEKSRGGVMGRMERLERLLEELDRDLSKMSELPLSAESRKKGP